MKARMKDARELFRALGAVDEDHFVVVENDCATVYSKEDFLPTPMPYGSCVLEIPDDKVVSGLLEEEG